MLRIGLVSDCYHPTPNGVTGVVGLLAAGLEERGHHVTLVAPRGPRGTGAGGADLARPSLPVLPSVGVRLAAASPRRLARLIADERLDVVHTHTEGPLGLAARRAAGAAGLPMVHTMHTFYRHYLHYPRLHLLPSRPVDRALTRGLGWFLRPYDRVVAPSMAARDHVADLVPDARTMLVPNGVDVGRAAPDEARVAALRARLGLPADAPVLLYVGRLAREKRSRELVDALAEHLASRGDVHALLVGGGGLLAELRRSVARRGLSAQMILPGYLPHRDVLDLCALASVFLTASVSENHPLSLLEAAAAGVPLAVRADANSGGLVTDGVTGIEAAGERELVGGALALIDDPTRRARLGANARQAAQRCSVDAHLDRMEDLYRAARGARSRRAGRAASG